VQPKGEGRTNSHPFDVREYGAAARDIGDSASQLNDFVAITEPFVAAVRRPGRAMQKESHHWVDYAVGKLLLLTLCIMVLGFVIFLLAAVPIGEETPCPGITSAKHMNNYFIRCGRTATAFLPFAVRAVRSRMHPGLEI